MDKLNIKKLVESPKFPLYLALSLFAFAALFMTLTFIVTGNGKNLWTIFGIELLLYMLLNAFCCLIVTRIGFYLKRTVLFYILNLILVILIIYLLLGENFQNYRNGFPAFEALVFCFFSSLLLISLIRAVVNFFKDEN